MSEKKNKHETENRRFKRANDEPEIAPSMEMDELDEKATKDEVKQGKATRVTQFVIDRYDRE